MKLGTLENNYLYLEYCPNIGGSIFKFQAKSNNKNLDIFRSFNKKKKVNIVHIFQDIFLLFLTLGLLGRNLYGLRINIFLLKELTS